MKHLTILLVTLACAGPAAMAQTLVAISSSRAIYTVDKATGQVTQFATASSNASTTAGLAYDMLTRRLFLTSTGNDSLYTLDLATGTATLVGFYGSSAFVMHGLEYDSSTGTLYGVSQHDNGLYVIDQTTGLATLVGTSGLTSFTNLVYDPLMNVMYATNSGTDSFYVMDRATGAVTLIGPLAGPTNPNGLAFDLWTNTIYMVDNSQSRLYTIDRTTGAATQIGSFGSINMLGLVCLPGEVARSAHGCGSLSIGAAGVPMLGSSLRVDLGNVGLPILGLGFNRTPIPFCGCTVGHDWAVAMFGASHSLAIPNNPALFGLQVGVQGADFQASSGCTALQLAFSDTLALTIG